MISYRQTDQQRDRKTNRETHTHTQGPKDNSPYHSSARATSCWSRSRRPGGWRRSSKVCVTNEQSLESTTGGAETREQKYLHLLRHSLWRNICHGLWRGLPLHWTQQHTTWAHQGHPLQHSNSMDNISVKLHEQGHFYYAFNNMTHAKSASTWMESLWCLCNSSHCASSGPVSVCKVKSHLSTARPSQLNSGLLNDETKRWWGGVWSHPFINSLHDFHRECSSLSVHHGITQLRREMWKHHSFVISGEKSFFRNGPVQLKRNC